MTEKKVEDMFVIDGAEGFEDSEAFDEVQEEDGELEKGDVILLTDQDGEDHPFAILDIIEYENSVYMVLAPDEETDAAQEVVIMQGMEDPEDPDAIQFESVDDDVTVRSIFAVFRERNRDEYDFEE